MVTRKEGLVNKRTYVVQNSNNTGFTQRGSLGKEKLGFEDVRGGMDALAAAHAVLAIEVTPEGEVEVTVIKHRTGPATPVRLTES